MPRTLIIYTYFETPAYARNLDFFLRVGWPAVRDRADLLLVANGGVCSVPVPAGVMVLPRENSGYDSAAWSAGLLAVDANAFEHFVLMNCTVRGPFLPPWARGVCWLDLFVGRLDAQVRAVGTTINVARGSAHIQTMLLATDKAGLQVWADAGLVGTRAPFVADPAGYAIDLSWIGDAQRIEAIHREIEFSQSLIRRGFNIACMLHAYQGVDFRAPYVPALLANEPVHGDPSFQGAYFGTTPHPFEVVFIKTERGMDPVGLELHTGWALRGR